MQQLVMQNCSKEALFWLFYNVSTTSLFFLLFLYFSLSLLLSFFSFVGRYPLFQRDQNEEYVFMSDEEEEDGDTEEEEEEEEGVRGGGGGQEESYYHHHVPPTVVIGTRTDHDSHDLNRFVDFGSDFEPVITANLSSLEDDDSDAEVFSSAPDSLGGSESDIHVDPADVVPVSAPNRVGPTSRVTMNQYYVKQNSRRKKKAEEEESMVVDEKFLVFEPTQLDSRKYPHQAYQWKDIIDADEEDDRDETEEIFGDSCTVGSTSKSSTEWRSSIRDSGTEFSTSSRRSCPKWESYTVFQKYDEEMIFLDRISAQKLHETESLRSIKVCPRSISDRIVHKISTLNKKPNSEMRQNPYHELEAAYAAQICLTWEALNWNYINFQWKKASHRDSDPGCPAHIAQQFQQFQVLLQRYIENEPYEHGRRPEVYARMRLLAPKLLLVPEYRDSEDDQREEGSNSRITSAEFLMIMEDGIKTFMNFLKADKEKPCQIIASFFKRNRRGSVDPALLNLVKKINRKKKMKLKDLRRSGKCLRKRKMKVEEEMEILMGLIDLKVVSRVLRTSDLSEQQLHWCEEKMSRVRLVDHGKLKRDPSPLFFPAH